LDGVGVGDELDVRLRDLQVSDLKGLGVKRPSGHERDQKQAASFGGVHRFILRWSRTGMKWRGLNAPFLEAPLSACPDSTPSRAERLAVWTGKEN